MNVFKKSKWIWLAGGQNPDSYAEFRFTVTGSGEPTVMRLSCDSDYTLFINGEYVASNQYGDYEHYKVYDELDLTRNLRNGENTVDVLVHYFGVDTQRYRKADAGLIYEIEAAGAIVAASDESTLSRLSPTYASGRQIFVTSQLGFTFKYDATAEREGGFAPSAVASKRCDFFSRPIKKAKVLDKKPMKSVIKISDTHYWIDLGGEVVGLPTLDFISESEQKLTVAWGEQPFFEKQIGGRNFYYEYVAKAGENRFTNYMLRLGCRYIVISTESPITLNYAGVLPQVYDVSIKPVTLENPLDRQIYNACVNTLRLCIMEHYVDSPWREQGLYAFDSKNQMLCGYYAFKDQNREYARSNLILLGEDRRADGLLSICSPCGSDLTIPSFSLYYIVAMREYAEYSGDISLINSYSAKMEAILNAFLCRVDENGLIRKFSDKEHWNFYDWSEFLEGKLHQTDTDTPDLVLNSLLTMALDSFEAMCQKASFPFKYKGVADTLRQRIGDAFFSESKGLFSHYKGESKYTVLGNSLAILCGAASGSTAKKICDKIVRGRLCPSSLSMNIWKYEALMLTDAKRYKNYVLKEIRKNYKRMLDTGSDTVWETLAGAKDFGGAGSLCHGWSAVPVYVYHRLKIARYEK